MCPWHLVRYPARSGPAGNAEFKLGDWNIGQFFGGGFDKESSLRLAVFFHNVVAVVREGAVREDLRALSDHAFTLDHVADAVGLLEHPLSGLNVDPLVAIIMDRQEVDERVGAIFGSIDTGHVDDIIDSDPERGKSLNFFGHNKATMQTFFFDGKENHEEDCEISDPVDFPQCQILCRHRVTRP